MSEIQVSQNKWSSYAYFALRMALTLIIPVLLAFNSFVSPQRKKYLLNEFSLITATEDDNSYKFNF